MRTRKQICIFILIILPFCISACRNTAGVELGDRLIMEAIGIDAENGLVELTIQALALGETGPDGNQTKHRTLRVSGVSVGEALSGIGAKTGLVPMYSQTRVLLFGEKTAKTGLQKLLDFFLREAGVRGDMLVAVASGKAGDIFAEETSGESVTAERIGEILTKGSYGGTCVKTELYRFLSLYQSESDSAFCPVLSKIQNDENTEVLPVGTAFFTEDKWSKTLSNTETGFFLFLTQNYKCGSFSLFEEGARASLQIADSKTAVSTDKTEQGGVHVTVRIRVTADLTEYISKNTEGPGEEIDVLLSKALSNKIEQETNAVFRSLFYESHHDVLRLYRRIALRYPNDESLHNYTLFDKNNTKVGFDVQVKIRWLGKERPR